MGLPGLLMVVSLVASGCGADTEDSNDRIRFAPTERSTRLVQKVTPPDPPTSADSQPGYEEIIEGFRRNAADLFERPSIDERIAQIERVFMSTGRYLELVAIYQQVVDQQGLDSRAAPRLGWAYVRLGQRKQAEQFLERLASARPDDPAVSFLWGAFWFNRANESQEAMARAAVAWQRTLELDGDFEGFGGLNARAIRQQLDRITSRLPRSPDAMLGDDVSMMAGGDDGDADDSAPESTTPASKTSSTDSTTAGSETPSEASSETKKPTSGGSRGSDTSDTSDETDATDDAGEQPPSRASTPTDDRASEPSTSRQGSGDDDDDRDVASVRFTKADLALGRGELDEAERLYQSVLDDHPDHPKARFGLVRVRYDREGAGPDLRDRFSTLLDQEELDARLAYQMGLFAESKLGDADLAEQCWSRVRELDSDFARRMELGGSDE
jgi:tetratricopeptide (TPR) repeat protein